MTGIRNARAPYCLWCLAWQQYPWRLCSERVLSEVDYESFVGRCTLHVPILDVNPGACLLLDSIQLVIRPYRVVVEEDQVFDLRGHGQLAGLLDETVPPAMFRWHIALEILGIVNQHIRVPTKLDKRVKARRLLIRWLEFVIRQVDDRPPACSIRKPVPPPG